MAAPSGTAMMKARMHLSRRDGDGLLHLRPAEDVGEHRQHVRQRRQQQGVDDAGPRQRLPRSQHEAEQQHAREDDVEAVHGVLFSLSPLFRGERVGVRGG